MDTQTLKASLRADARADQRERNRQRWDSQGEAMAGRWLAAYVPLGADLTADRALLGEVWDNAPEMWGAPSAADYTGSDWESLPNGRKRTVLPFA